MICHYTWKRTSFTGKDAAQWKILLNKLNKNLHRAACQYLNSYVDAFT